MTIFVIPTIMLLLSLTVPQGNKMKKTLTIFVIPTIMLLLSLTVPQGHVVALNVVEIILLVIHCIVCYYYVKSDDKKI
uniref:Uncharacterized protein n=1 Tax=Escherichia phage fEgEco12 TaxID=3158837 RepID=A0AAU7PI06_9CAUD